MTKIKICGLRREQDIGYVNRYLPDYVGFIFVERRRRYISFDDAERLKQKLAPQIQAVGVFLDEEVSRVTECVRRGIIDVIQLHGREPEAPCKYPPSTKQSRTLTGFVLFNCLTFSTFISLFSFHTSYYQLYRFSQNQSEPIVE